MTQIRKTFRVELGPGKPERTIISFDGPLEGEVEFPKGGDLKAAAEFEAVAAELRKDA